MLSPSTPISVDDPHTLYSYLDMDITVLNSLDLAQITNYSSSPSIFKDHDCDNYPSMHFSLRNIQAPYHYFFFELFKLMGRIEMIYKVILTTKCSPDNVSYSIYK